MEIIPKSILMLLAAATIAGGPIENHNDFEPVKAENACYASAAAFKVQLEAKFKVGGLDPQANILYVERAKVVGHAVTVFYFDGFWRVYDPNHGTIRLNWDTDDTSLPDPAHVIRALPDNWALARWYP